MLITPCDDSDTSAPIVVLGDEALSQADLFAAADAVAADVRGMSSVAVHATPTGATLIAVLGCLRAGVPFVPVPPDSGTNEREHLLRDSGADAVVGEIPEAGHLERVLANAGRRSGGSQAPVDSSTTGMIMYTSGTTGRPKGVVLSIGAIAAGLDALADAWGWTAEDTVVHGLPMFHAHGLVLGALGSLRVGGRFVHAGGASPRRYAEAFHRHGGTMLFGVPTIWSRIVAQPAVARGFSSARLLVSGSAPLPFDSAEALAGLTGQRPVERYGMTETLITLAMRADSERRTGWVGTPIAGVSARIVSSDGELIAGDGETVGELQVRGPSLFDGYLGLPAKTAEAWTDDGYFRTGDLAVADAAECYRIVGRESVDLIKSGGYRVGAGEIEATLEDHPGVTEAAVIGVPDSDLGQRVVAYVVGDVQDADALIEFTSSRLSHHKRPREIRLVDALPRNPMGKIQKSSLLKQHEPLTEENP